MGIFRWSNNYSCNQCCDPCCNNDCCYNKKSKPDVLLYPVPVMSEKDVRVALPMVQKDCVYELLGESVTLTTLKCDRELVVKVKKVQNIKVEIIVQTGTETPRTITLENINSKLVISEKLKKGDTIVFLQTYTGVGEAPIDLKFKAMIKKHDHCC